MYSEAELRALVALSDATTSTELAEELDQSTSYTSELVSRLESKGLVTTTRSGKKKRIRRSDARAIELLDRFVQQYSHIPFPKLLGGSALRALYYLDTPASAATLAERADVDRSTVYRALEPLENRGLVYRTDGDYALNDEFVDLATLAREFAHIHHRQSIEEYTDAYTILWEDLDEFLFQTDAKIDVDSFLVTGPERFQEYGLPLLARQRRYYLYSDSRTDIPPAELCCHILVIDDGPRSRSYCLLLLRALSIDRDALRSTAQHYGVDDMISELLVYLDTEGTERAEKLPTWAEFRELADEYGVSL